MWQRFATEEPTMRFCHFCAQVAPPCRAVNIVSRVNVIPASFVRIRQIAALCTKDSVRLVTRQLDSAPRKLRDGKLFKLVAFWLGKHLRFTESRLFAESLSANKTTGANLYWKNCEMGSKSKNGQILCSFGPNILSYPRSSKLCHQGVMAGTRISQAPLRMIYKCS